MLSAHHSGKVVKTVDSYVRINMDVYYVFEHIRLTRGSPYPGGPRAGQTNGRPHDCQLYELYMHLITNYTTGTFRSMCFHMFLISVCHNSYVC